MRLNTRPGRRLAGGAGVIAALALGLAGITSTALPSNAVQPGSATNDPTSINEPGADNASEFPGYNGYVDPDKADAVASSAAEDTTTKPADPTLGEPDGDHDPDVPGAGSQPEEPDSDEAQLTTPTDPSPSAVADVTEALDARGTARVVVMTDARQRLEGDLGQVGRRGAALGDRVVARRPRSRPSAGTGSTKVSELTSVPSAVYAVTDDGPRRVAGRPGRGVRGPGRQAHGRRWPSSTGVIDSDLLNTAGVLGNNFDGSTGGAYQVAIIDSGVDNQHNAFTGRIVAQACFVADVLLPERRERRSIGGRQRRQLHVLDATATTARMSAASPPAASSPAATRAWPGARGIVAIKVGPGQPGRQHPVTGATSQRSTARSSTSSTSRTARPQHRVAST